MIEVQCPSCQTRYRIDESVLPPDSPTFKCSRCGHVFSGDPRLARRPSAPKPKSAPPPMPKSAPPPQAAPMPAPQAAPIAPPPQPRHTGSSADLEDADDAAPPPVASVPPPVAPRPVGAAAAQTPKSAVDDEADNPLARSFAEEDSKPLENLSFDFGDDPAEQHHLGDDAPEPEDAGDRWQVGDPEAVPIQEPRPARQFSRYQVRRNAATQAARRQETAAPAVAADERGPVRSSSFFLAIFALMVIGFALMTFALFMSPSASRALLAKLPLVGEEFTPAPVKPGVVSLRDVHAEYRVLDRHRSALIVSGRAENRGEEPLHAIQIAVSLVDGDQRPVVTQAVFCGDLVSPKIVAQMTPRELQFFQKLAPPRNFALKSGDSSPFFVMFLNPPPIVANFQVSVLKAEPATGDATASSGI